MIEYGKNKCTYPELTQTCWEHFLRWLLLAAWQEPLQCRCHSTTTLLPFCLDCAGFGAVSTWLIVLFLIFINLASLAARQATAMPLPLMQLCCCILPLAAWQHLLPMPLPQCHDAFSIKPSPGRCMMLGVMVVGVVTWCCCCNQQRCWLVLLFLPVSVAFPWPFPSHISGPLLSIAIAISFHCHHHCCPLPLQSPSIAITATLAIDSGYHC